MPFWAGMLTEDQHPHEELQIAVRQASWDLYFRHNPVCEPPGFVADPGLDLPTLLDGQPILVLDRQPAAQDRQSGSSMALGREGSGAAAAGAVPEEMKAMRGQMYRQSWANVLKAAKAYGDCLTSPSVRPT